MAFAVEHGPAAVEVTLSGFDRMMAWRRRVRIPVEQVVGATVADRGSLEQSIDHRALGIGTHTGARRPGRRRVGTMLGRAVPGKQFWAVAAGPPTTPLLVLDLDPPVGPFERAVLECDEPDRALERLGASR